MHSYVQSYSVTNCFPSLEFAAECNISAVIPVFLLYYLIQQIYITTSREIQRLDSICKSPVMALFSESLGGLSTIRAYLKCVFEFFWLFLLAAMKNYIIVYCKVIS